MIHSLRLRLLLSFGLVIALILVLIAVASMFLLRDHEARRAEESIGHLVGPISRAHDDMVFVGWSTQRINPQLAAYAEFFDVRVLLVDGDGRVTFDSDDSDSLVGESLPVPQPGDQESTMSDGVSFVSSRVSVGGHDLFVFAENNESTATVLRLLPETEPTLYIAVPAGDVTQAWAELLPRLLLGGGIAAVFAVVVSTLLAQRITRPIVQMTGAAQAMARGDYEQSIEVRGNDEVANLARAFNQMSAQVNRSNRSMRQLLADVSHELRTPLTSIQGFTQAFADGVVDDPEEARRLAEVVHEESERMRELVDDLLYLSRLESGELEIEREPVDLDALITATVRRLRFEAEAARVRVEPQLGGGLVIGDERRLEQVCVNLLENAIRFAPSDSAVTVSTRQEGNAVVMDVHNGGPPVPADELDHIFDRFYQVDRARSGSGHSGLGLAIVAELVQAHEGSVDVWSNSVEGTVFCVKLPAVAVPVAPDASSREPA
ncbi:MAG: HAMP domain-containing sensor histidine kinase [Chloroflexota bacterium]|nr:HAMP domain-containing sensor histidine kinase [Chloroflexota bacterium]